MNRRGFFGTMLATPLLGLFRKKPKTMLQAKVSNDMGASEWSEPIEVDESADHPTMLTCENLPNGLLMHLNSTQREIRLFKQTAKSYGIILGD